MKKGSKSGYKSGSKGGCSMPRDDNKPGYSSKKK